MDPELVHRRRWGTLAVLSLSLLIIGLDNTVLNVAIPTLQAELDASASQLQWIIDSYTLAFAGLLLTAGSWGDKFGRRRALSIGLIIFGIASTWAAFSTSAISLISARTLMGIGGALVMPSTLSILTNAFVEPRERKTAIGIWAGVSGLGIAIGPALGGWLLEHYWWGSVFLLNVPVVVLALTLGFTLVPESRDVHAPRLDLVGAALSTTGLIALVWAIIEAPSDGWTSAWVLIGFTVGGILLLAFTLWELRTRAPMLDVRLFKRRRFGIPALAITLVFFALFGSAFFLSIYLQTVLGYNALAAGLRILPVAAGMVLGAPLAMAAAKRIGEKWPTVIGLVLLSGSLWMMSDITTETTYWPRLLIAIVLLGFGMGFAMGPATESVMGALPRAKAGVGSAVNDTVRQVGGALGVAVLGSILNSVYASKVIDSIEQLPDPARAAAKDNIQGAYAVAEQLPPQAGGSLVDAANLAFVDAVSITVLVAAGVVLLGAVLALLLMPSHGADVDRVAEATDDTSLPVGEKLLTAQPDSGYGRVERTHRPRRTRLRRHQEVHR